MRFTPAVRNIALAASHAAPSTKVTIKHSGFSNFKSSYGYSRAMILGSWAGVLTGFFGWSFVAAEYKMGSLTGPKSA
ncbi:uncharacterized protein V1516DRAFT_666073 [Lipomyces oligophaga]|uniref:uncharacterized protein n=1 Tax=Lipomyces oligophaga TaxID=45792 RepID=UPI0034CE54D2